MSYFAHPTAVIDLPCSIGDGTKIWHFVHIYSGATIGQDCVFGQNTMVAADVVVGDRVRVQNNVAIYTGTIIEDDVFLGPSCVLTNVTNPRAEVDRRSMYETIRIRRGATVCANATIVCGVTLDRHCFIAAGSVVTRDVPAYALMVGIPARRSGWMSRHGFRLTADVSGIMTCPESGLRYREVEPGVVQCLDLDERAPMPDHLRVGRLYYDQFRRPSSSPVAASKIARTRRERQGPIRSLSNGRLAQT